MKKYEIISGWYNSGNWCEGSNEYETISDLIEGYNKRNDESKIVRICLTCEYSNSLYWETRAIQKNKDYIELNNQLIEHGIYSDFVIMNTR